MSGAAKKRHIDKYTYLSSSILGQGYSGTVYLGKHQQTGERCAIKIIEKSILKYQAHKSMILCQIEFLTNLKNKENILTLFDVYTTKNNVYLISELCNTDLKEYLNIRKRIQESEAIEIINKIIIGFKAIWEAKIIHRDLKPSNILIKGESVKIADFGFSMYENQKEEYAKINVGSPLYMPQEVLGYNSYSFQSDIWALGIIFYEMLKGKTPWKANNERELFNEIVHFDIEKYIPEGLTERSKVFLRKTLQKNVEDRMTPEELIEFNFCEQEQRLLKNLSIEESRSLDQGHEIRKTLKATKSLKEAENPSADQNLLGGQLDNIPLDQSHSYMTSNDDITRIEPSILERSTKVELGKSRTKKSSQLDFKPLEEKKPQNTKNEAETGRRRRNVNRKQSLETNYQPFQGEINSPDFTQKEPIEIKLTYAKKPQSTDNFLKPMPVKMQRRKSSEKKENQEIQSTGQVAKKPMERKEVYEIMKDFSKMLRSQIHYCRFIFKLLERIDSTIPMQSGTVRKEFRQQMTAMIFDKLQQVLERKITDAQVMKEWLQTKQWEKVEKVVKQYLSKYSSSLKGTTVPPFDRALLSKYMRKSILHLYKKAYDAFLRDQEKHSNSPIREKTSAKNKVKRQQSQKSTQIEEEDSNETDCSEIMKIKGEIIILDYLITFQQLLAVEDKVGWEGFEKKAKIESIVEGQPLDFIQQKHIFAISDKLEKLKIL